MKIALIGKIGSGKSEALKVAREMGVATLSADEINAELLSSPSYVALLGAVFPTAVKGGRVDRAELARIVFSDAEQRARLNALAHPRILARIAEATDDPLVVETPVYDASGAARCFDFAILVTCPEEERKRRLLARGMSEEDIAARLEAQSGERLERAAKYTILNNCSLEEFRKRVRATLECLLSAKC